VCSYRTGRSGRDGRRRSTGAVLMRILSLGAGVQSTTVALMSIDGTLPRIDHAVFADTGWEPAAVYEHLDRLESVLADAGVQTHRVTAGNIRDDALTAGRFASMPFYVRNPDGGEGIARRQCTNEYKLAPIYRKVRELVGLPPRARSTVHLADMVMGISLDEAHRMRDVHYPWIRTQYPLVDSPLTRHDCQLWLATHWPHPVPRSACIGCPFHSDLEWRHLRDDAPSEWADAIDFERQLQTISTRFDGQIFLHPQRVPLEQVDLSTPSDQGQGSLWAGECEGMCGT